jgi:hypothetical protein
MSAFSFTAPYISDEEEKAERGALTEDERQAIHHDLYGDADDDLEENESMLQDGLLLLQEAIEEIPVEQKLDYLEALGRVPDLVENESSPVAFLRAQRFDSWAAASHLVAYWKQRKICFGETRAFLPMTLQGAIAEDVESLEKGICQILVDDKNGRMVFFLDRIRAVRDVIQREVLVSSE